MRRTTVFSILTLLPLFCFIKTGRAHPGNPAEPAAKPSVVAQGAAGNIDCSNPDLKHLPMCSQPAPAPATPSAPKPKQPTHPTFARPLMGGGVMGTLIVYNRGDYSYSDRVAGTKGDITWIMEPVTGGPALFLDARMGKHVAFGGEFLLVFPRIDSVKPKGLDKAKCTGCKRDILFVMMLMLKFPIKFIKYLAAYPLIGGGMSIYRAKRESGDDANKRAWMGFSFTVGAGLEGYPMKRISPLFEIRYLLTGGWHHENKEGLDLKDKVFMHMVLLNVGVRFY